MRIFHLIHIIILLFAVMLIFSSAFSSEIYAQPFFILEENVQRDFYCEANISIIESGSGKITEIKYYISRRDSIIKIAFNLSDFITDPFESDNLVKLGIDKNVILFDMANNALFYIFPELRAFIIQEEIPERYLELDEYTLLADKKLYDYIKEFKQSEFMGKEKFNRYTVTIRHKKNKDNWNGFLLESERLLNFPSKLELESDRLGIKMVFDFANIRFEPMDDLFSPPQGYRLFENYNQLIIYAIESIK